MKYLGNCPFHCKSKKLLTAAGMAMAVIFVTVLAGASDGLPGCLFCLFLPVFSLAPILFAGVRERILLARVPKPLQDTSIGLVTVGLLSLAFFAFKGTA